MADEKFYTYYTKLANLSDEGSLNFILRYIPGSDYPPHHISMTGYGAELAIKNTEYKVSDDRDFEGESSGSVTDKTNDFDLFPGSAPMLSIVPNDKLGDIYYHALSYVVSSSFGQLAKLAALTRDFPRLAHLVKDSDSLLVDIKRDADKLRYMGKGLQDQLYLNGLPLIVNQLNAFTILSMMRSENSFITKFQIAGFRTNETFQFLENDSPSMNFEWGESFDVRSESVIWLNDIEVDSRYNQMPNSINNVQYHSLLSFYDLHIQVSSLIFAATCFRWYFS